MDALRIIAAVVLGWTNPTFDRDTIGCASGGLPLNDLDSVKVIAHQRYAPKDTLLVALPARGLEGQRMSYTVTLGGVWSVWVTSQDDVGNVSCPSNVIGVGLTTDAPVVLGPAAPVWYDVSGRRMAPKQPGVYFTPRHKKVVR